MCSWSVVPWAAGLQQRHVASPGRKTRAALACTILQSTQAHDLQMFCCAFKIHRLTRIHTAIGELYSHYCKFRHDRHVHESGQQLSEHFPPPAGKSGRATRACQLVYRWLTITTEQKLGRVLTHPRTQHPAHVGLSSMLAHYENRPIRCTEQLPVPVQLVVPAVPVPSSSCLDEVLALVHRIDTTPNLSLEVPLALPAASNTGMCVYLW